MNLHWEKEEKKHGQIQVRELNEAFGLYIQLKIDLWVGYMGFIILYIFQYNAMIRLVSMIRKIEAIYNTRCAWK